ncbi:MAG: protein of unknown function hydrolase-like [Rickettsiales bacterium]|nr:protein of unknown function hydrolase-like [Rickettsiales bacterium]
MSKIKIAVTVGVTAAAVVSGGMVTLSSPPKSSNVMVIDQNLGQKEASIDYNGTKYNVWYGTNRKLEADGKTYGSERDKSLRYGTVKVFIPRSHKFGSIGSGLVHRLVTLTDDRLKIESLSPLQEAKFWEELKNKLQNAPDNEKQALIYIHGYNVSFEEAAIRAAQIGYDLKVPGVMGFFSWPSRGNTQDYSKDEATIEVSEAHIVQFLEKFAQKSGAKTVHILAHSMGNRGFLRALQRIAAKAQNGQNAFKFGQIFLAAPDLDRELFEQLAYLYPQLSARTTLYVSPKDKAVATSAWLHGAERVGYAPPVTTVMGIDTVEVSGIDVGLLGHSYFAEAEPILRDMYTLLRDNRPPLERQRLLQEATLDRKTYWRLQP